jgi:alkanesulfonate monooxygenase SsuD/methylene tetrahydromethanopterin reductase-like flavin-dependent oxidoreductase (luciferase family)
MRFSVHLPLIDFTNKGFSLDDLLEIARTARRLDYSGLSANDHLVFGRPWLDGLTALAAVLPESEGLHLATTVSLPVIRGPLALARALSALDVLSGGRVIACVGPGSAARDYAAIGLDFEERWSRLDESVRAMRAYFNPDGKAFKGRFYSTEGVTIEPRPVRPDGIPIWIGSWGSEAGLRRVARLADGWLASAYNTTPALFAEAREKLNQELAGRSRDAAGFPNALATCVMYLTDDDAEAERLLREVVAPALNRKPEEIGDRILVCSTSEAVERLSRYAEAGLQEVYLWPCMDEVGQLERFAAEVAPRVAPA